MLDGWKSTIGLALLYLDKEISFPDTWWMQTILVLLYIWTGVGITHKVVKAKKGTYEK